MRLVFAGTPDAAVPTLRLLAASAHDVVAVVTRTDAPLGRKRVLTPSPVAQAAAELGIPIIKADRLDDAVTDAIRALEPDLGVIVAYGGLVREPLLSLPEHGWINLHFSLLPRWRGAAPVQRALIAGDAETGAAVFQLVPELDAGAVFAQLTDADAGSDRRRAARRSRPPRCGPRRRGGRRDRRRHGHLDPLRSDEPTTAPKLTLEDGRVRWDEPREAVLGRIRGVTPEPGAHTTLDGARLKLLDVSPAPADALRLAPGELAVVGREIHAGTSSEPIVVNLVQPAGKGAMRAADWWRGLRVEGKVIAS